MNEKKPIKISLSTFFLIIAIIVIVIMGYFMYQFYTGKAVAEEQTAELNSKVNELQSTINNVQSVITNTTQTNVKEPSNSASVQEQASKNYSYKDISGVYKFNKKVQFNGENDEITCILYLYKNGTFNYQHQATIVQGILGNYIIDNDTIILNKLFRHGNDLSLGTTRGELKLKLNEDYTITDSNNSFGIEETKNITFKKLSTKEEQEYSKDSFDLIGRINACIEIKSIYNGEN